MLLGAFGLISLVVPWGDLIQVQWMKQYLASGEKFFPIVFAIGVTYISIFYTSGTWYQSFQRFRVLGIEDAEGDRRGREVSQTEHWLSELDNAKSAVTLSGVTLAGWFVTGWDSLPAKLEVTLRRVQSFDVFLMDPMDVGFKVRAEDKGETSEGRDPTKKRMKDVLDHIKFLYTDPTIGKFLSEKKLKISLYKGTPLSSVWIDDKIYYTPYLPYVPDRQCP
jgi:hypothetical protein